MPHFFPALPPSAHINTEFAFTFLNFGKELYNVISIIGKTRTLNRINEMVAKYNIF